MAKGAGGPGVEPQTSSPGPEPTGSGEASGAEGGAGGQEKTDRNEHDFLKALSPIKAELRCVECGYGVVAAEAPAACPMCQAMNWEQVPWRPFSRLADFVLPGTPRRRHRR